MIEETVTGIEAEFPLWSVIVIVAVPPPTAVTVNVACVSCARRAPCVFEAMVETLTVATLVFEDAALNVPL